jgi:hypothetical protein
MTVKINASTSSGLVMDSDLSGTLELQANGVTKATIDANGLTATAVIPSGSTAPTNGTFLPATNTLGFSTASTERMRIDSSGNLLVGTTSVFNQGFINAAYDGQVKQGIVLKDTNATLNGSYMYFLNSAGTVAGQIAHNGTATVAYSTSSDYRLKDNIAPMTGALDRVAQLKPVTYSWKVDGSKGEGFIAHELAEVVPDCVTGEKDAVELVDDLDAEGRKIGTKEVPRYQGIDTSFLVATLTAAIQEQQAIITDLKARIETLEAK